MIITFDQIPDQFGYISSGRWRRIPTGTHEKKSKRGKSYFVKIASHSIQIKKILFILSNRKPQVHYILEFLTSDGTESVKIRHEDLADEQAFFKVAPPGFSLTSIAKAFSLLRECLMGDLQTAKREAVLTILGWYRWKGKPIFAHAGGIISSDDDRSECDHDDPSGTSQLVDLTDVDTACSDVPILAGQDRSITAIRVEVPQQFAKYRLNTPQSKSDTQIAVRAVLDLLELGDPNITYIAIPTLFAAAIRNPRFALFLYGESGSLKTAFAMLLLSFFLPDPQESDCASFKSTANALRARFATSGNVAVIVDDYVQVPGARNGGVEAQKAEELIRSVVNGSGKDRSYGDGSLRPNDRPRGLPIITGEQLPDGIESLRRRCINLPVDETTFAESVQGPRPNQLDRFQELAKNGVFANAMSAFIAWASGWLPRLRDYVDGPGYDLGEEIPLHLRLPEAADYILSGADLFLQFSRDIGVCSEAEFERHAKRLMDATSNMLGRAYLESLEDSPTEAFGQHLQASMSSLQCHIEVRNIEDYLESKTKIPLELLGYTQHEVPVVRQVGAAGRNEGGAAATAPSEDMVEYTTVYKKHGKRIGWLCYNYIDLIPEVALAEANSMATKIGMPVLPSKKIFGRNLVSKRWIAKQSKDRNTYKARHGSVAKDVWRIHSFRLFEFALQWCDFDIGYYKEMSLIEQQKACDSRREQMLSKLRGKVADYQAEKLLNQDLSDRDRQALLIPDPPPVVDGSAPDGHIHKKYEPGPPKPASLPGYGEPEGDGLIA